MTEEKKEGKALTAILENNDLTKGGREEASWGGGIEIKSFHFFDLSKLTTWAKKKNYHHLSFSLYSVFIAQNSC